MTLRSKLEKAKNQGYIRTLEVVFNRFIPPWIFRYSKGDIYEFDIEKLKALGNPSKPATNDGLIAKCHEYSPDNSLNAERMRLREFTWNTVPLATTNNDLAYGIFDASEPEKILGGLWAAVGSFSENNLGVEFDFADHQAWLYCAYVHDEARGRGVYKKLISFAARDLEQRGFSKLYGIVQPWNKISRLMHEKQSRGIRGRMSATRVASFAWISHTGNLQVDRRLVTDIKSQPASVIIN